MKTILKQHGLKQTVQRLAVLEILKKAKKPLSIEEIKKHSPQLNTVTIYRILEQFNEKGITYQTQFKKAKRYYELQHEDHHHHITCTSCNKQEAIHFCIEPQKIEHEKTLANFATVHNHTLELFGTCTECATPSPTR